MAKNLDQINKLKHQKKEYRYPQYQVHTPKQIREALMSISIIEYSNMLDLGMLWHIYKLIDVIFYLEKQNVINKKEVDTLVKMDASQLNDDKVMAFAIVQQKYKAYKNRFSR
tara:strand:+ start:818 stop:1153 length:336 start_codon:yes stop_codon:yes gene_type:complete